MNSLYLKILGLPRAKQSAQYRIAKGKSGKQYIASYQKRNVKDNERNIAYDVKSQLPEGFVPWDQAIGVKVLFVFPPLSSWPRKKVKAMENGGIFYKITKPDLTDNLMKGLFDAMEGIVYINDSRIANVESKKIYGQVPRIELEFYTLYDTTF